MKRFGRVRDAAYLSLLAILSLGLVAGAAFAGAPRPPSGGGLTKPGGGTRAPQMYRSGPGAGSLGSASGMSGSFNALGALGAALGGGNTGGYSRPNQPNYQSYYPNYQTGYPNYQAGYYQPSTQVYTNQDGGGYTQGYSNYSNYPGDASGFTPPAPPAFEPGPVVLVNPAKYGTTVYYRVEGTEYQIPPGTSHTFERGVVIDYHRGGSFGRQQYSLEPGTYRFQGSTAGWELYNQGK